MWITMKAIPITEAFMHCSSQEKLDFLRKMRTIDAEEVVHCIECVHYNGVYNESARRKCAVWGDYVPSHGFCHRAEKDG